MALGGAGAVIAGQFGRMLRRRAHEEADGEHLVEAAPAAALDTVERRRQRLQRTPRAAKRSSSTCSPASSAPSRWCGSRPGGSATVGGRFSNVSVGGRHIHHFVPGILIGFASATTALLTDDEVLEERLAVTTGVGMGLTFDEAALLLDLRDVYWTREGLLSVQLSLGATAILSIAILTQRMLRRGERRQEAEGLIPSAESSSSRNRGHKKGRPHGRPFFPFSS